MTNWQETLKRIFANHKKTRRDLPTLQGVSDPDTHQSSSATVLHLDDADVVKLMHCLSMTVEGACTCAEAYALLDQYTELVASDEQAKQLMPLVKNHMDMCPDCREEFEVLLKIVHSEKGEL
ncbi:MAG TPA: hypothetical protein PLD25_31515 [Chloroflexota bacterium]|nr:hypothetical protein [Chloroflexota bacterium]HUM71188.1 hypothetical protein [Chloroflexota bacterium]